MIVDELHKQGIPCFGPNKIAAQIESSKAFAKDFMTRHQIPTARHQTFEKGDEALSYIDATEHLVAEFQIDISVQSANPLPPAGCCEGFRPCGWERRCCAFIKGRSQEGSRRDFGEKVLWGSRRSSSP